MHHLEPVIQNIRNSAAADRRGIANNLETINSLYDRITELRGTNVWLEKRAVQYDSAVQTLEKLKEIV